LTYAEQDENKKSKIKNFSSASIYGMMLDGLMYPLLIHNALSILRQIRFFLELKGYEREETKCFYDISKMASIYSLGNSSE